MEKGFCSYFAKVDGSRQGAMPYPSENLWAQSTVDRRLKNAIF